MNGRPDSTPTPLAAVTCRTFRGHQGRSILLLVLLVGPLLSGLALLGVPPSLSPLLLIAALALGIGWLAGRSEYTLTTAGIQRRHRRFLGGPATTEFAPFTALTRWRHDRELSRSLREYEYFEFDRQHGPRWVVTNRQDPRGFAAFREAWFGLVGGSAVPGGEPQPPPMLQAVAAPMPNATEPHHAPPPLPLAPQLRQSLPIPRRPGRYQGPLAKGFAVLAAAAAVLLGFAALQGDLDFGQLLRLGLVVVPGAIYMLARSFRRSGNRPS